MCFELIPGMIFCSIGVICTCLAIFQVRRERDQIYLRMYQLEKTLEQHIYESRWKFLDKEINNGIK